MSVKMGTTVTAHSILAKVCLLLLLIICFYHIIAFIIAFLSGIFIPVIVGIIPTKRAMLKNIPDCISGK